MDALTLAGVLCDDTRVVRLAATKEYAAVGEQEHVAVTVRLWEAA
jgi:Holliday junction resolvase RusA-like endonuclease